MLTVLQNCTDISLQSRCHSFFLPLISSIKRGMERVDAFELKGTHLKRAQES